MYYLAYGSNLHPLRTVLRAPDSRLVGAVRLAGCRLVFQKLGSDGSSKCSIVFTKNPDDVAHAVVYAVSETDVQRLDEAEGLGVGYLKQELRVTVNGEALVAFVYIASQSHVVEGLPPYDWYKEFVLAGARRHCFPPSYVQQVAAVTSMHDPDDARRTEMEALLALLEI